MFDHIKKINALILAAGNSERMGSPKFMLRFDENHSFLEKIVESYQQFGCEKIIVVLNPSGVHLIKESKFSHEVQIVLNSYPEWERFYSIKTGLKTIFGAAYSFIHHVDNPFVDMEVLKCLHQNINDCDYLVPYYKGQGGHPILISGKVMKKIVEETGNKHNLKIYLQQFVLKRIEVETSSILVNINTMDEYNKFFMDK